ncbi:HAD-superfamily hydrolase, subfamily IA, variant 3 [Hyella patelloides LEGE 07179]|uniref:HAD-superfamily hydrolase, subfamily IA, variant 3 n=1 Tax=Hyella patelloides LEGE 07179 TaxID=945734 RepID=A0A563VWR1_9CYAN|nr:HAD family phosphatase [Hyella patelloides]VEP15693.1 HAD-superfamily hydrolase, subfamily IA, variant 3 [Hyella patelloides LEGE 07179]
MGLKAVLFDFNGVIINDETIHQELITDILLGENLRSDSYDFQRFCLGRSDRACLRDILKNRGRVVSEDYLNKLINRKTIAYKQKLSQLETLPIYPGLNEFLNQLQQEQLVVGLVTGALKQEALFVLEKISLVQYFSIIVAGDDITSSKPEPDGYLLAVSKISQQYPELNLQPNECLVIEDTYAGIEAAKRAGMQVVGISHTYPLHMLQRRADWTVDYLADIEIARVNQVLSNQEIVF